MALNKNNSAVKRIMQEARELANDLCTDYSAAPLEDDIFEWHCTLRGPSGTEFEGGLYHFRILLPAEYPFRPPSIMILTPNGRFELNTKICISFTNYHEELWQPAWGVRTAIIGLQGFFPLKGQAAVGVGSIEYPPTERKRLAALSRDWICPICKMTNVELLPDPSEQESNTTTTGSIKEVHLNSPSASENDTSQSVQLAVTSPLPLSTPQDQISPVQQPTVQSPEKVVLEINQTKMSTISTNTSQPALVPTSQSPPTDTRATTPPPTVAQRVAARSRQSSQKPPLLLDSAICVLVVLVFTIICRRMV